MVAKEISVKKYVVRFTRFNGDPGFFPPTERDELEQLEAPFGKERARPSGC